MAVLDGGGAPDDVWGAPIASGVPQDGIGPKDQRKLDVIRARIGAGLTFMRPHVDRAERSGNRYLDSSARTLITNRNIDGETRDLPVGEINYMARRTWPLAG